MGISTLVLSSHNKSLFTYILSLYQLSLWALPELCLMIIVLMSPTYFPDLSNEINIYSLRTDSWKTLHDQLYGIFLINFQGKHVNKKLHWIASTSY